MIKKNRKKHDPSSDSESFQNQRGDKDTVFSRTAPHPAVYFLREDYPCRPNATASSPAEEMTEMPNGNGIGGTAGFES